MFVALIGVALASIGLVVVLNGIMELRGAGDDAEGYLRSLDWTNEEADEFEQLLAEPFVTRVLRPIAGNFLGLISSALPGNYRDSVHEKLVHSGMTGQYRAEEIITAQALCAAFAFLFGLFMSVTGMISGRVGFLLLLVLPVVGLQLPITVLGRKIEERRSAILKDLPDTLDLLAVSVEAGVGFEGAIGVVTDSFVSPLSDELARMLREMELGLPRRQALENLKRRTDVPALNNFILTLIQADALGMPIGRVLKTQAGEMRTKRRQWAREKAAKLPVKILFPLMPILLAVFIVVLGPAASQIGTAFN